MFRKFIMIMLPVVLVLNLGAILSGTERFYGFSSIKTIVEDFPLPENIIKSYQSLQSDLESFQKAVEKEPQTFKDVLKQISSFFKLFLDLIIAVVRFLIGAVKDTFNFIAYVFTNLGNYIVTIPVVPQT